MKIIKNLWQNDPLRTLVSSLFFGITGWYLGNHFIDLGEGYEKVEDLINLLASLVLSLVSITGSLLISTNNKVDKNQISLLKSIDKQIDKTLHSHHLPIGPKGKEEIYGAQRHHKYLQKYIKTISSDSPYHSIAFSAVSKVEIDKICNKYDKLKNEGLEVSVNQTMLMSQRLMMGGKDFLLLERSSFSNAKDYFSHGYYDSFLSKIATDRSINKSFYFATNLNKIREDIQDLEEFKHREGFNLMSLTNLEKEALIKRYNPMFYEMEKLNFKYYLIFDEVINAEFDYDIIKETIEVFDHKAVKLSSLANSNNSFEGTQVDRLLLVEESTNLESYLACLSSLRYDVDELRKEQKTRHQRVLLSTNN